MQQEYILCASIVFEETMICGHRHSDCYAILQNLRPDIANDKLPQREHQGFLTSKNRYVSRQEGWNIAKAMGQIKWGLEASENGEGSQLISENLY